MVVAPDLRRVEYEPALGVGAVAAVVAVVGVAVTCKRSTAVAAGVAALVALGQAVAARSLVSPVATVEDARNEGAAEILDAVAESRLDPDLWEAIRAVPPAVRQADDATEGLDPSHPHGKEQ
jgi:hypothetical protein